MIIIAYLLVAAFSLPVQKGSRHDSALCRRGSCFSSPKSLAQELFLKQYNEVKKEETLKQNVIRKEKKKNEKKLQKQKKLKQHGEQKYHNQLEKVSKKHPEFFGNEHE